MDTKTALLDSAEQAIRARGYDGFSYADLATEVGIRKASVHHHFPTKADLALALIARYSEAFFAQLHRIEEMHPTGGARLNAYVSASREAIADGQLLCLCVAFCTGRDALSPEVLAKLDHFHLTVKNWLKSVFLAGQTDASIAAILDPDMEAHACLAQIEGAQLIARAAIDGERFDVAVATILHRIV